jgi:hypothetical protein
MTSIVGVIKDLYDNHKEKIEGLKQSLAANDENFVNFEMEDVKSYQKAVQEALANDITIVFGDESASVLDHILKNSNVDVKNLKRSETRRLGRTTHFTCEHVGCGLRFVNAGNLKNHMFAHERDDAPENTGNEKPRSRKYTTKYISAPTDNEETIEGLDISLVTSGDGTEGERKRKSHGGATTRRAYSLDFKMEVLRSYDELNKQGISFLSLKYCVNLFVFEIDSLSLFMLVLIFLLSAFPEQFILLLISHFFVSPFFRRHQRCAGHGGSEERHHSGTGQ